VGRARVRFRPAPEAEREQLRQFGGTTTLDRAVKWAFVRLQPIDFYRALGSRVLEPEPNPGARRAVAERVFRDRAERSFIVDAPLPRSPWWLMPGVGDAVVDFPWGRKRVPTLAHRAARGRELSTRPRPRSTYRRAARPSRTTTALDVLEHITARFDPELRDQRHASLW
jgi:hypothetical protein